MAVFDGPDGHEWPDTSRSGRVLGLCLAARPHPSGPHGGPHRQPARTQQVAGSLRL